MSCQMRHLWERATAWQQGESIWPEHAFHVDFCRQSRFPWPLENTKKLEQSIALIFWQLLSYNRWLAPLFPMCHTPQNSKKMYDLWVGNFVTSPASDVIDGNCQVSLQPRLWHQNIKRKKFRSFIGGNSHKEETWDFIAPSWLLFVCWHANSQFVMHNFTESSVMKLAVLLKSCLMCLVYAH